MDVIRIKEWDKIYENNKTRILQNLDRIQIPINWGSDGYLDMMDRKDGPAIFGAWIALVQVAAKCKIRGTLVRSNGLAHSPETICRLTRVPILTIKNMLEFSLKSSKWLEIIHMAVDGHKGAAEVPDKGQKPGDLRSTEGEDRIGKEGQEGNGRPHLFKNSVFFDFNKFREKLVNWDEQKCKDYWEAVKDWSASKAAKRSDWIATARNFERRDRKENGNHPKSFATQEYEKRQAEIKAAEENRRKREPTTGN